MPDSEHGSGDVLARLEAMAPELPEAIAQLEQERSEIDEKLKRLRTLHRAITGEPSPTPTKTKRQSPSKTSKSSSKPSDQMLKRVGETALSFDEPFTAKELIAVIAEQDERAPHESIVRGAIKYLREIEFLGAAGKRLGTGAPVPPETYRVLDREALDAALSEERPNLAAVA